jgi:hypothetical protein
MITVYLQESEASRYKRTSFWPDWGGHVRRRHEKVETSEHISIYTKCRSYYNIVLHY